VRLRPATDDTHHENALPFRHDWSYSVGSSRKELPTMPQTPQPTDARKDTTRDTRPEPLWTGTGLCCEAQGDGVPCQGTDGECASCGRALPPVPAPQRRPV